MSTVVQDLRYALRLLWKNPGFATVAIVTLALGIGANTAIFSVVHGILLRPLPFEEADRLVVVCEVHTSAAGRCSASPPNVEDWSRQSRTLESIGLGRDWPFILKKSEGVEGLSGGIVTPGYFRTLGLAPHMGRLFEEDDLVEGNRRVVILSHDLWQSRFGGDREIVGRTLTLDDLPYNVIGVLPPGTRVPRLEYVEIWAPLDFDPRDEENRGWRGFTALGRLGPDTSREQAQDEMNLVAQRLGQAFPGTNDGWGIRLIPLQDYLVGSVRPRLFVFLGAVGLVLLVGCANLANLLLARARGRRREIAVRAAIGAGRRRLVRQLMTESVVLALCGGGLGLLLSYWAVHAFVALAPGGIPRLDEVAVDGPVFFFAALLSLLTSLLFGLAPALQATRVDINRELKQGLEGTGNRPRLGLRAPLLTSEVAVAVVLLIGAGLLTRSFATLLDWQPGFDSRNLLTTWLLASSGKYTEDDDVANLFDRAADEVRALPGVVSVGRTSAGPLFGGEESDEFLIEGRAVPPPGERPVARWYDIDADYFRTLGLPLLRGRSFAKSDTRGAPQVAIVNDKLARRHWPDQDPIGQQVTFYERTMTIVGVVGDVQPFRPGDRVHEEIYWPQAQSPRWATYLLIRTGSNPGNLARSMRQRLEALDPDLNISGIATLEQRIGRQLVGPRFNMLLLGLFAAVALVLAAIGVYGVIAYSVARRTREFGIRVALGAGPADILRSVLTQGMAPALIGVVLGLLAALPLSRGLRSLLHGVEPTDPATFAVIGLLLAGVALVACWFPARRATRVDPTVALRHD